MLSFHESNPAEEDWKSQRPYFGWQSEQVIQNTYKVTFRFGGTVLQHDYIKYHINPETLSSTFPKEMNVLQQILF